jgi:hypothetical protein
MRKKIVLATATAGALAFLAYSTSIVPTAFATGVQLNPGLSGLVGITDDANLILVKKGGGGKGGKGGGAGRGGGGGKHGMARHGGGGKSHAKRGGGDGKRYARHDGDGKSHANRRGGGGKTNIVYRDGHRYWHGRQIWWWGPLVYSYDPCIRWVRFCPGCAREPINICYYGY